MFPGNITGAYLNALIPYLTKALNENKFETAPKDAYLIWCSLTDSTQIKNVLGSLLQIFSTSYEVWRNEVSLRAEFSSGLTQIVAQHACLRKEHINLLAGNTQALVTRAPPRLSPLLERVKSDAQYDAFPHKSIPMYASMEKMSKSTSAPSLTC